MALLWFLSKFRSPAVNAFFQFCTLFGEEIGAIAIICLIFWCVDKKMGYRIGFAFFVSGLFVQSLKISFRIPRPWIQDPAFQPVGSAVETATGYSFPSGHTQSAASIFGVFVFQCKKRYWKIVSLLIIFLVGLSRMMLGVHTPYDVGAAWILTGLIVWGICSAVPDSALEGKPWLCLLLCYTALAVAAYSWFLYRNGTIEYRYARDCFKAGGAGLGFAVGWYLEARWVRFQTDGTWRQKAIRLIVGLLILLGIKSGLKPLLSPIGVGGDMIRYAVLVMAALAGYPWLFQRLREYDSNRKRKDRSGGGSLM